MVIFDANFLLLLFDPDVDVPEDPATGLPLQRAKERVEHLIEGLSEERETIGIPTPVLAEVLVHAGEAGAAYLTEISGGSRFRILPFDTRAAVEVAAMTAAAITRGDKTGGTGAPWQEVKIDRQILAIAVTGQASTVFTDDRHIVKLARGIGLHTVSSWDLPAPPENPQGELDLTRNG